MTFSVDGLPYRFDWYGRLDEKRWRVLRQYVYERDGGKCRYCGTPVELFKCHCHHVLPLREDGGGGTNHPTNLKTLCRACHKGRHPHMKNPGERVE